VVGRSQRLPTQGGWVADVEKRQCRTGHTHGMNTAAMQTRMGGAGEKQWAEREGGTQRKAKQRATKPNIAVAYHHHLWGSAGGRCMRRPSGFKGQLGNGVQHEVRVQQA